MSKKEDQIDQERLSDALDALADCEAEEFKAEEITPAKQLELDIDAFNRDPVLEVSVAARIVRYQERGALWAMPHKVYCKRVKREVFFMDYSVKGEERDDCIEGNPTVPKCPFAKQDTDGNIPCEHYKQYPFGIRKTVSINTKDIKKKK